jgi:hypothetical protein
MFFLYHARSAPTGRVLAEALGAEHGTTCPAPTDVLIRWGSRVGPDGAHQRRINNVSAIAAASDKLGSLSKLREAGVRVPDFSTDPTELEFPFLGRKRSHARGTDVVLCLQAGDYKRRPRDYYVQYVPTLREFRVHVVGDEVIRVQGKFLDHPELAVPWIRNHAHGYRFRAPRRRLNRGRLEQAVLAVKALGLDFGAVDLLIGDDGQTYVLEVNTAPSCSPLTGGAYIAAFQRLLGLGDDEINLGRLGLLRADAEDVDSEDAVEGEGDGTLDEAGTSEAEQSVVAQGQP